MSIAEFSKTIQSEAYKKWLDSVERNIIQNTVTSLRSKEQVASKTQFYITASQISMIYETITGTKLSSEKAEDALDALYFNEFEAVGPKARVKRITVGKDSGLYFPSIGFDIITEKLRAVLDLMPNIQTAYALAEDEYLKNGMKELQESAKYKSADTRTKRKLEEEVRLNAARRGTLGYYFNKGHVISIATNAAIRFRNAIEKANNEVLKNKKELISVLDAYIKKLENDDRSSANLPGEVGYEFYAEYTKSPDSYLVEMQLAGVNISAGTESLKYVEELRKLFSAKDATEITKILQGSNTLGTALLNSEGSPSMLNLISQNLVDVLKNGKKSSKKTYSSPKVKVGKKTVKVKKPNNKKSIAKAKELRSAISKSTKSAGVSVRKETTIGVAFDTITLQNLINSLLAITIKQNMGDGTRRDILNLRSGRFADSVKIERMSESREGMITAFYTYMKYPYQTFEPGYRQGRPESRNPKLLISRSIREIAAEKVANRLRAVSL